MHSRGLRKNPYDIGRVFYTTEGNTLEIHNSETLAKYCHIYRNIQPDFELVNDLWLLVTE